MSVQDIITKNPWLRSDPGSLTGTPPRTVAGVIGSEWEQVFIEWLVGTSKGQPNWQFITRAFDKDLDETGVLGMFHELGYPATTDERKKYIADSFQPFYLSFTFDVGKIQGEVAARAKEIRAEATASGKKISESEARRAVGHEVAKEAVRQQVQAQKDLLGNNINIALVANLQLKTFQVTALQEFKNALNGFGAAKWDIVPENPDENAEKPGAKPSAEKAEAMGLLNASGTAMFASYERVSKAIAQITALDGAPVPDKTSNELFEAMLEFGQAVAGMSDSIGQASRLFGKWARRTTRAFIRDNFDAIYPHAALGFTALRTIIRAGGVVAGFFPEYGGGLIVSAVSFAEAELELAITAIVAWDQAKDPAVQKKYALQEFKVKDANKNDFLVRADRNKKKFDEIKEKVTTGAIEGAANKVAPAFQKVGEVTVGRRHMQDAQRRAGHVAEFAGPAVEFGAGLGGLPMGLGDVLAEQVPVAAVVIAAKEIFFDWASLYTACHSELRTRDGITPEQLEKIHSLIDKPPQNAGFLLFGLRNPVSIVGEINFPITHVQSGKVRFQINLETNEVRIDDPAILSNEILSYAKQWAKSPPHDDNGLRFHGAVYRPRWDTWKLDPEHSRTRFTASIEASHFASPDRPVTLKVSVDLNIAEMVVTESDYVPAPQTLDGILAYNAGPPADGKFAPLEVRHIQERFDAFPVTFEGAEYILSGTGQITFTPAPDWTAVVIVMTGIGPDGVKSELSLEYAPMQMARVFLAKVDEDSAAIVANLAAAESLIAENEAKMNSPEAKARRADAKAAVAELEEALCRAEAREAKELADKANARAKNAKAEAGHAERDLHKAAEKSRRAAEARDKATAAAEKKPGDAKLQAAAVLADAAAAAALQDRERLQAALMLAREENKLAAAELPGLQADAKAKGEAAQTASAATKAARKEAKAAQPEKVKLSFSLSQLTG